MLLFLGGVWAGGAMVYYYQYCLYEGIDSPTHNIAIVITSILWLPALIWETFSPTKS